MKGLGISHPALGLSFTVFILGLIGVPITAGFLGKLLIVQAGIAASTIFGTVLVLILAANSAISLGYYVPIISTLLFQRNDHTPATRISVPLTVSLSVAALAIITIYFGLFPQALFSMIGQFSGTLLPMGVP
jgi:NADH:ubiquinone oxidoreductase subunit 2 (subunit N)